MLLEPSKIWRCRGDTKSKVIGKEGSSQKLSMKAEVERNESPASSVLLCSQLLLQTPPPLQLTAPIEKPVVKGVRMMLSLASAFWAKNRSNLGNEE